MKQIFKYKAEKKQNTALHLGNLSRPHAIFCLNVSNNLNLLLKENAHSERKSLVLAVSGGVDSIAMLGILLALQKKYPRSLCVAHFNHGIRCESDDEAKCVEEICLNFNIPFYIKKENIPLFAKENKLGLEEAARKQRYLFLEEVRQKTRSDYICIAHHAHDLAEDMLMRLCRGTAWPALAGMSIFCDNRKIIRPLLYIEKQVLTDFVEELELPYAQDMSNESQDFLRNRVRKHVLPFFLKENPQFLESIYKLHECAQEDDLFFQEYIDEFWRSKVFNNQNEISMIIRDLQEIPKAMRLRIYKKALSLFQKAFSQNTTLKLLDTAVMRDKGGSLFKFTKKIRARIEKGLLIFYISY